MENQKPVITVHYVKNQDFKTVFMSGVHGGFTTGGLISFNVFTERPPIPKSTDYAVDANRNIIAEEVGRDSKEGIMREVQFGVVTDVSGARLLADWLYQKANELEQLLIQQKNREAYDK